MIIEADFLNHWKTKALGNAVGELAAMRALLSLWAHCQRRRAWEFQLTAAKLAGICDFHGDKEAIENLWHWMRELEWLDSTGEMGWFRVHQWGEVNASLVGKWAAPMRLKSDEYPPRGANSQSKERTKARSSDPSPDKANALSIGEDRIGLDGIGEERNEKSTCTGTHFAWEESTGWQGITDAVLAEFTNAYPTLTVREEFLAMNQWLKANPDKACKRNWRSFANNWLRREHQQRATLSPPSSTSEGKLAIPEKKEKGPPKCDFPWKAAAEYDGWTPAGEWEDQTPRTRSSLRQVWRNLPAATKAAMWALCDDGEKKEGAAPAATEA